MKYIKHPLTIEDIKELKLVKKANIIFPSIFFFIAVVVMFAVKFKMKLTLVDSALYILLFLIIYIITSFLLNRKYKQDIQSKSKKGYVHKVQKLDKKIDFEAGAVGGFFFARNKPFNRYDIVVDNTRYKVRQDVYEGLKVGEKVIIFFADVSNMRLDIEKWRP